MKNILCVALIAIGIAACGQNDGDAADKDTYVCTCGGQTANASTCRKGQQCTCNGGIASCD